MTRPLTIQDLNPTQWQHLSGLLDEFERAWQQAETVDLVPYLPTTDDPMRGLALRELIKTDLEIGWRKGLHPLIENYVRRFPELGEEPQLLPHLLAEEHRVRHRFGDKPLLTEYRRRFPEHYPVLERLLNEQTMASLKAAAPPAPAPQLALAQGESLPVGGGYTLVRRIGQGAFGEVWKAEAPGGIDVAIKVIFRSVDDAESKRELAALELIKRLHHPFLLQTNAFWPLRDRLVIAMELAEGSLRNRSAACRASGLPGIPERELLGYMYEVAEALDYLHENKVLHRDIKPDNILLIQKHAKVADFGLARMDLFERSLTASMSGTPPFMGPEAWRGKPCPASDQFSLAASYVELRQHRRPYQGTSWADLVMQILQGEPDLELLPPAEREVLCRALHKDPAQRYPSCTAFFEALAQAVPVSSSAQRQFLAGTSAVEGLPGGLLANADTASGLMARIDTPASADRAQAQTLARPSKALSTPAAQQEPVHWRPAPRRRSRRPQLAIAVGIVVMAAMAGIGLLVKNWKQKPPPEVAYVLPGCDPVQEAGLAEPDADGLKLWWRIDCVRDGIRVPFVLVQRSRSDDPQSFYIMQDKVTNGLFKKFVHSPEGAKWAAKSNPWHKGAVAGETDEDIKNLGVDDDDLPVFHVTAEQAQAFARWLGGELGDLPTIQQWNKAAGAREHGPDDPDGPFQKGAKPGELTVGRAKQGPARVTDFPKDTSRWHCHQMAGNGKEWTCTQYYPDHPDRLDGIVKYPATDHKIELWLRGGSYKDLEAWRFDAPADRQPCDWGDEQITFRVVLKIPDPSSARTTGTR